jgi:hypothetical protein
MRYIDMEKMEIIKMSSNELDGIVSSIYKQDFEFVCAEEACNDREYFYQDILKDKVLFPEDIQKFKDTGEYMYMTRAILQDMVNNGKIPEGSYLICVSW